ncbi:hypothetical protein D3C73_1388070 [compost metagenome]
MNGMYTKESIVIATSTILLLKLVTIIYMNMAIIRIGKATLVTKTLSTSEINPPIVYIVKHPK